MKEKYFHYKAIMANTFLSSLIRRKNCSLSFELKERKREIQRKREESKTVKNSRLLHFLTVIRTITLVPFIKIPYPGTSLEPGPTVITLLVFELNGTTFWTKYCWKGHLGTSYFPGPGRAEA